MLAALAFYLAFQLRFFDSLAGMPQRYSDMLWGSIVFVALGKTVVFSLTGLHQKWWRYFNTGDTWAIVRGAGIATALMLAVYTLAQPYSINIPRSVLILDFAFTVGLLVAVGRGPSATGMGFQSATNGMARSTRSKWM